MATFINISENNLSVDENQVEGVKKASELVVPALTEKKGAAAAKEFEEKFATLYGDGDKAALLELFLPQLTVLAEYEPAVEEGSEKKPQHFEAFYAVTLSILATAERAVQAKAVEKILPQLIANSTDPTRLRLLMILYNTLEVDHPSRAAVFTAVLDYGNAAGLSSVILPYCSMLGEWLQDWDLNLDQKADIYGKVATMQRSAGSVQKSRATFIALLDLYENEGDATKPADAAVTLICDTLNAPDAMDVSDVLVRKPVQALASTKHKLLLELCTLFRDGNLTMLNDFHKKNGAVFKEHKIDFAVCETKMKMLALSTLAGAATEMPLADVAKALQASEEEAEKWVVMAVNAGILNARVDQLRRVVLVKSSFQRSFGPEEWTKLHSQVGQWIENLEKLQGVFAATRSA